MECNKCGTSDQYRIYYDVLSPEGVITLCKVCCNSESYPIIRKKGYFESPPVEKRQSVFERMQRISGVKVNGNNLENNEKMNEFNQNLRKMVEDNVGNDVSSSLLSTEDMVDNFHWVVMRARRSKKMTIEQFARELREPIAVLRMVEEGKIPSSNPNIIRKIESFLGIRLRKDTLIYEKEALSEQEYKKPVGIEGTDLSFDPATAKRITISDLKRMKEEKEAEFSSNKYPEKKMSEEKLSDEDIEDIIFGRK